MEEVMFFDKDEYSFDDIKSLIDNNIEESIHLDFKESRALAKKEEKKTEICKDISAFANSDGGIIIYGIAEKDNKADSVSFIDGDEYSKEWLEQIASTGIQRRIDGIRIYPIRKDGDIKQTIYIVKIPCSYSAPHMTKDKKYYKRFNFQSVQMEEYEVRQLYDRKGKSKLCIADYYVAFAGFDDKSLCKFKIKIDIENIGLTAESTYKVNFYINRKNMPANYAIPCSWERHIDHNDYQLLMLKEKAKISYKGRFSVFPTEWVNAMDIILHLSKEEISQMCENATLEIELFYSNGIERKVIDTNIFNEEYLRAKAEFFKTNEKSLKANKEFIEANKGLL